MSYAKELKEWQREYWLQLAKTHDWNVTAMAKAADVNRTNLHARLVRLGLKPKNRRHLGNWGGL